MAYEYPSNANIATDKPVRAADIRKIRDMVPGLAAGDASAPSIAGKALASSGRTWQSVSRTVGTSYENTSTEDIQVCALITNNSGSSTTYFEVSSNGSTWLSIAQTELGNEISVTATIPVGSFYRISDSPTGGSITACHELKI